MNYHSLRRGILPAESLPRLSGGGRFGEFIFSKLNTAPHGGADESNDYKEANDTKIKKGALWRPFLL